MTQQNIILSLFQQTAQAYQAFSELKNYDNTADTLIAQAVLIKKENNTITLVDSYDQGEKVVTGLTIGGLLGSLVGALGGPVTMLFGGAMGALVGSDAGTAQSLEENSLLEYISQNLDNNETAILVLAQESNDAPLDSFFAQFQTQVRRWNAEMVQNDIYAAVEAHDDAVKQMQQAWKEKQKTERELKMADFRDEMKQKFTQLADKFR